MHKWVAVITAASWPGGLLAQSLAAGPERARPAVSWGTRVGLTYSNTNFNAGSPPPPTPIATTWQPGFLTGFWVSLSLPAHLLVRQEYVFEQLSGERVAGARYTLRYLSLPLLLGYRLGPKVELLLGPRFDLLIQAQQTLSGQLTDITHDTEERSVGATAGIEVALSRHLGLGARYVQGLNHIGIGQRSAVQEFKLQSGQLAATFRF